MLGIRRVVDSVRRVNLQDIQYVQQLPSITLATNQLIINNYEELY